MPVKLSSGIMTVLIGLCHVVFGQYTYVANESNAGNTSVYFDDFTIIHEKNSYSLRVVESTDYDPFGSILEGTRYVDISRPLNGYLYQGEYAEFEELTGWSRFQGRGNYDAALGRWGSVDPMAHSFAGMSPFTGMGNNPVMIVDPDGRWIHIAGAALIGGIANTWSNWDKISNPWQGIQYFAVGAASGAITMVNPLAGASVLSAGNLGVDVINGHPPDFQQAVMDFGFSYIGGKAAQKSFEAAAGLKHELAALNASLRSVDKTGTMMKGTGNIEYVLSKDELGPIWKISSRELPEMVITNYRASVKDLIGSVDDFLKSQLGRMSDKLGDKIGKGKLPFSMSRSGRDEAIKTINETLSNATELSDLVSDGLRGKYQVIDIYSTQTNYTVRLRLLENGKFDFDTLIPGRSGKFR
jgi:RHS repeat-associated protein